LQVALNCDLPPLSLAPSAPLPLPRLRALILR